MVHMADVAPSHVWGFPAWDKTLGSGSGLVWFPKFECSPAIDSPWFSNLRSKSILLEMSHVFNIFSRLQGVSLGSRFWGAGPLTSILLLLGEPAILLRWNLYPIQLGIVGIILGRTSFNRPEFSAMMIPNDANIFGMVWNHHFEHRKQKLGHRNHVESTEILILVGQASCLMMKLDNFLHDPLIY